MTNFLERWQINSIIVEVMESSDFKYTSGKTFWDERQEVEVNIPDFYNIEDFIRWFADYRYLDGLSEGRFNVRCELKGHLDSIKQMVNI